jgi:hypothetical protein
MERPPTDAAAGTEPPRLITTKEAARRLVALGVDVSERTVRRAIKAGKIRAGFSSVYDVA